MLRPPALLMLVVLVLAGGACATQTAPITGREQRMVVSEATVIAAAAVKYRGLIDTYAASNVLNTDPAETERVRRIAGLVIVQAKLLRPQTGAWDWEVNVARDPTANAWCMAGGKMMIYSGIMTRLHLTDSELAAVVAHETAHAVAQHQRELISDQARNDVTNRRGDPLLGIMQASPTDPRANVVVSIFMLPYSREKEAEADRIGLTLMARAGFDPQAMATLFEKLDAYEKGKPPRFLSNHPSNRERVADIRAAIAADPELSSRSRRAGDRL